MTFFEISSIMLFKILILTSTKMKTMGALLIKVTNYSICQSHMDNKTHVHGHDSDHDTSIDNNDVSFMVN